MRVAHKAMLVVAVAALAFLSGCRRAEKPPETPAEFLMQAARAGDVKKVTELLDAHPELVTARDEDDMTALHHAASGGSLDVVKLLLERGADADARDRWNVSPMERAALQHHEDVVTFLMKQPGPVGEKRPFSRERERQKEMRDLMNEAAGGD